jgi:hypothetical protein
LVSATLP